MKDNKKILLIIISVLLTLLYFAFLNIYLNGDNNISPDSADYYNIARNLSSGKGFIHTIKWHFFNDDDIIHSAVAERPPLYPLLLSLVLKFGGTLKSCLQLTMMLGALAIALFFLMLYSKSNKLIPSLVITFLIAFNPNSIRCFVYLWTESLYFLLFVLTLIFLPINFFQNDELSSDSEIKSNNISNEDIKIIIAGIFASLSYLTRPSGMFLIASIILWFLLIKKYRGILLFILPSIIILGVWFILVWKIKGNPFYSVQKYHLLVNNIRDGMSEGYGRQFASSFLVFFISNPSEIIRNLEQSFRGYAMELFSGSFLSFLGWFLLLLPFSSIKKNAIILFGLLGAINYFGHSLVWATHEGFRFMLFSSIPFVVLVIFTLYENNIKEYNKSFSKLYSYIGFILIIFLFSQYIKFNYDLYNNLSADKGYHSIYNNYTDYFKNYSYENDIIAASDPFYTNYKIDRPTIQLPSNLNLYNIQGFSNFYNVKYFMLSQEMINVFSPLIKDGTLIISENSPRFPFLILEYKK